MQDSQDSNNYLKEDVNELTFRDYFFILRTNYKKIIFCTLIGLGYGIYNIYTTPPSYIATATIVIREKPGANIVMDLTGNRDENRIKNELELIKSRKVAKATIEILWKNKKNNLALFESYPFYPRGIRARRFIKEIISLGIYDPSSDGPKKYSEDYSEKIGEQFAESLINSITLKHRAGSDIIDISCKSVWPEESKLLVNTVVDVYKQFDQKLSSENAANSVVFLERLVNDLETQLNIAEKELTEFKKKERMYDLDGAAIALNKELIRIESEIYNDMSEINIRQDKYDILKTKLSNDENDLAEMILNTINLQLISLRNEMSQMEAQLIQNIVQYGEGHGAVLSLKSKMNGLRVQINTKVKELTNQGITVQDPLQARQNIVSKIIELDNEITALRLKMKQSESLLKVYDKKLDDLPRRQLQFSALLRNSSVLNQNYSLLRQKLEEAKINVTSQLGKVQIVDYARSSVQAGMNDKRTILMTVLIGMSIGLGLAIIKENLDDTLKTIRDIEKNNLTVLGIIPSIGEEGKKSFWDIFKDDNTIKSSKINRKLKRRLITRENPRSPVSEAYRSLRTSLLYTDVDQDTKSILVSSAGPGEGKTTTVANMAITYANLGKKTLLIDTDLRRPVVHKVFNLGKDPGITNYLASETNDFSSLIHNTEIPNLSAVTSGVIPPNPSELLGSNKMSQLIKSLEKEWDIILFDSPPLVAVTDATMISKEIDKVIIVVKVGQTDKKAFEHTIQALRNVQSPLGGVVLNAVTHRNSYGSYYYYYQYYNYYGNNDN